jgi:hypothetical protein
VRAHILGEAGKQFDPRAVEAMQALQGW